MVTWRDIFLAENISMNVQLEFYIQNGGLNMVLCNGEQLQISKKSRREITSLLAVYRSASYGSIDFSDTLYPMPLAIHFHNGVPNGQQAGYKNFQSEINYYHNELFQKEYAERLSS